LLLGLCNPTLTMAYAPYPICLPMMYSSREYLFEKSIMI
jgi:hypothetical protein